MYTIEGCLVCLPTVLESHQASGCPYMLSAVWDDHPISDTSQKARSVGALYRCASDGIRYHWRGARLLVESMTCLLPLHQIRYRAHLRTGPSATEEQAAMRIVKGFRDACPFASETIRNMSLKAPALDSCDDESHGIVWGCIACTQCC